MAYRDQTLFCALCGQELAGEAMPHGGLQLCAPCHAGKSSAALIERGLHLQTVEERSVCAEGHHHSYTHALGAIDHDLPIEASFAREGVLGRWLKNDLQTGDEIFDRAVAVRGDASEPLVQLLALEPVRWAIIDLLDCTRIELSGGVLRVSTQEVDAGELRRPAAVILWGMLQVAQALGLPRRESRILPVLDVLSTIHDPVWLLVKGDRIDPGIVSGVPRATLVGFYHAALTSEDLSWAARAPCLEALRLVSVPQVRSLEPLAQLTTLRTLVLQGCPVEDVRPLARLTGLRGLNLGTTRVTDLSPLMGLAELEELILTGLTVDPRQLDALQQIHPRLRIEVE